MPNRSPITDMVKKAKAMVFHVQENLSAEEYAVFLDMVDPLPEEPAPTKKSQKKAGKKSSKSPRASGMAAQLKERREQREPVTTKDDNYNVSGSDDEPCTRMIGGEKGLEPCEQPVDHNIHHLKTHPGYHEFQSGKSAAPSAPTRSPANGAAFATERSTRRSAPPSKQESDDETVQDASLSIVDSEDETVTAGAVAGGLNE